jgi:hypothetical protein
MGLAEGKLEINFGKTDNARRRIPMTPKMQAILEICGLPKRPATLGFSLLRFNCATCNRSSRSLESSDGASPSSIGSN